jgi:hypothetical protein
VGPPWVISPSYIHRLDWQEEAKHNTWENERPGNAGEITELEYFLGWPCAKFEYPKHECVIQNTWGSIA